MDLYTLTTTFLSELTLLNAWPEMRALLERRANKQPHDWRLPVAACEAAGGEVEQAIAGAAAVACLQTSIILVDDLLDNDPRGEYRRVGAPAAANLAIAFQAAGLEAITMGGAAPAVQLAVLHSLNRMALTTALGQYLDAQNPTDEASYWRLVRAKSSPFFGSAFYSGALLGGASGAVAHQLAAFGCLYGEMIQIHDDLNDVMATPANPDWLEGRSPLPILFAQVVAHRQRKRFLQLRKAISDPEALREAQDILIACGAISYCVDQLLHRYQAAQKLLAAVPLAQPDKLMGLLEPVIMPVLNLFAELGVEQPESLIEQRLAAGVSLNVAQPV